MPEYKKHFTIEEARALVPQMQEQFKKIHALLAEIREGQEAAGQEKLRILKGNGKGPIVAGLGPKIAEVQKEIEAIAEIGIQIKDLQRGLIDFPHYLQGDKAHEVFLCYELSEDTVLYWHEIEDGFAGRHPL
jgi:hypothetical protein